MKHFDLFLIDLQSALIFDSASEFENRFRFSVSGVDAHVCASNVGKHYNMNGFVTVGTFLCLEASPESQKS